MWGNLRQISPPHLDFDVPLLRRLGDSDYFHTQSLLLLQARLGGQSLLGYSVGIVP